MVIQTRWHEADLAGWLLKEHASEGWTVINFPAVAEADEDWRKEGSALWPERFPLKTLARIREAIGTSAWAALYQQRPAPEEGAIFKKDWFLPYGGPIECTRTIFSLDCAFKTGQSNDYSVIAVVSEAKTGFHIRLVSRGRWEFPELKRPQRRGSRISSTSSRAFPPPRTTTWSTPSPRRSTGCAGRSGILRIFSAPRRSSPRCDGASGRWRPVCGELLILGKSVIRHTQGVARRDTVLPANVC